MQNFSFFSNVNKFPLSIFSKIQKVCGIPQLKFRISLFDYGNHLEIKKFNFFVSDLLCLKVDNYPSKHHNYERLRLISVLFSELELKIRCKRFIMIEKCLNLVKKIFVFRPKQAHFTALRQKASINLGVRRNMKA